MSGIFVSHSHSDEPLANSFARLIETLFRDKIPPVNYSSRKELEGGIAPGEDWFRWIVDQVGNSDVAVILLTPNSVLKPWLLWEAGAVTGAAFSTDGEKSARPVYPLVFSLDNAALPGPFSRTQIVRGDERAGVGKLVDDIYNLLQDQFNADEARKFGASQQSAIDIYLNEVAAALPKLPIAVTEASVQEWIDRLDKLSRERRFSEGRVMESWMDVAFGRDESGKDRPLDLRLHRRLAEIYGAAGHSPEAERQYTLARRMAPRDIFTLRALGKSKLDRKDTEGCRELIEEIEGLDPRAFEDNPESAALKGRWQREAGDRQGEIDTLEKAYRATPASYYLGDLLGQALIDIDDIPSAKKVYEQVIRSLSGDHERNIWTKATTLSAVCVLGDVELAEKTLEEIEAFEPNQGARESIQRGLKRIQAAIDPNARLKKLLTDNDWM